MILMMIHEDAVLVTCNADDWTDVVQHNGENTSHDELRRPFRFNRGETLYYLKKKLMLARQGI